MDRWQVVARADAAVYGPYGARPIASADGQRSPFEGRGIRPGWRDRSLGETPLLLMRGLKVNGQVVLPTRPS
ncbi:MAG: hypothetical protein M1577_00375 [Chloroflexi bacterium]|nr:hypothetical protein [Chloroflexota bacterium]